MLMGSPFVMYNATLKSLSGRLFTILCHWAGTLTNRKESILPRKPPKVQHCHSRLLSPVDDVIVPSAGSCGVAKEKIDYKEGMTCRD